MTRVLLVDNYDSFTYNLVHYLQDISPDVEVEVVRNDALTAKEALAKGADAIVLSPGPCTPDDAGICLELIKLAPDNLPILGVCLGHQAIGQAFGGKVIRAGRIMHGKTSPIHHAGQGVFAGLPDGFEATRYHSLVVDKQALPGELEVTAWTTNEDGSVEEIMGLRHRRYPIQGVQFHPESIMTQHGHAMLKNFLAQ